MPAILTPPATESCTSKIVPPTDAKIDALYRAINEANRKPAIQITQPYAKSFVPSLTQSILPQPMMELYTPSTLDIDLLKECETVFDSLKVTEIVR